MNLSAFLPPLLGGALIGVAASLLLLFQGRVFGVSGILGGVLAPIKNETAWRVAALAGLLLSGVLITWFYPAAISTMEAAPTRYVLAGLAVGYGTQLGSGCTSGHGVCGISRLSRRSLSATVTFIAAGMLTVTLMRLAGVSL